jgi:copper chaperone
MKQATFEVAGMSCDSCIRHVSETLRRIDGVTVQTVEFGSADVSFDPAKVNPQAIATALTADGYPAMLRTSVNSKATTSDMDKTGKPGGCCCR